eukprot:2038141-Amphidinium_carterae.3
MLAAATIILMVLRAPMESSSVAYIRRLIQCQLLRRNLRQVSKPTMQLHVPIESRIGVAIE